MQLCWAVAASKANTMAATRVHNMNDIGHYIEFRNDRNAGSYGGARLFRWTGGALDESPL
jgi:hypothetical protein